ncbi:MAG: tetratricopeptide repeat protein [Candidatus Brocadiaceae bacterium]|nr:tetratricopeptide repeat protein [Candidatus Brocadiaceae bacterium]
MRYIKFLTILIFSAFLLAENIHANEYIAFSLKVAQQMILSTPQGKDYRKLHPEVFTLGGITAMNGLVYDRKTGDVILVGQRDPERAILTLDDFVVALRARFIHGKWPLVSIDPTPETEKTQMQVVRFEGGIEDTQFGQNLFEADYKLKQIGMGLIPSGVPGLKTNWELSFEEAKKNPKDNSRINSRFWFYPVLPIVTVREDVVAMKGLKVSVFSEILFAEINGRKIEDVSDFNSISAEMFCQEINKYFNKLAQVHPPFLYLQGLYEFVALSKAIEEMIEKPNLSYWLEYYRVNKIKIKKEIAVLGRNEEYEVPVKENNDSNKYYWYPFRYELSGGIELIAIAIRLKAGQVEALKDAVMKTRPRQDTLLWGFIVGEWIIPTSSSETLMTDVASLLTHAYFLYEKKHYDDAIILYEKIIKLKPDCTEAYVNKGVILAQYKENYKEAISDFNKALEIDSKDVLAYYNRGNTCRVKGQYDLAISDFNKSLEMNPFHAESFYRRGLSYSGKKQFDKAILDYNIALNLNPGNDEVYIARGDIYSKKGQFDNAISDLNRALEINPRNANAFYGRGIANHAKDLIVNAISDYTKALEIDPKYTDVYLLRGCIYNKKGLYDLAIADFNIALELDPKDALKYYNRALAYCMKKDFTNAWNDVHKADGLGYQFPPGFLQLLRKNSGRQN